MKHPHGQILEGSVHALSYLIAMARAKPLRVWNHTWNPDWSPLDIGGSANIFCEMDNGVRCQLESSWAVQATINGWGQEYLRADCEHGALVLDQGKIQFWKETTHHAPTATSLPLLPGECWGHAYLVDAFISWISGQTNNHPTSLENNLQCMALLFAAVESGNQHGAVIDVQQLIEDSMHAV